LQKEKRDKSIVAFSELLVLNFGRQFKPSLLTVLVIMEAGLVEIAPVATIFDSYHFVSF